IVDFIRAQWQGLVLGVVAFLIFLIAVARIPSWRRRRDRLFLRLPLIGRFMRLGASAQYLRTLALVIRSRLPLTEAMRHASAVLDMADHRDQAVEAGDALSRGESLSQALTRL
ncbi:MAG: type II secretion system F family protein, partial [Pseudomonadota bacterium]